MKKGDKVKGSKYAITQGMKIPKDSIILYSVESSNMVTIEYISNRTGKRKTDRYHKDFLVVD